MSATGIVDSKEPAGMASMEECLSCIYAVLEPSEVTALQEHLPLDSPGSVTVDQVAAALKVIKASGVALSALRSFCEKHGFPVDWWGDSTEEAAGSGVADRRAEIAGAANSTVPKPSEEQAEGAVRSKACTEGDLSTDAHVPVGKLPQPPFTAVPGRRAPPKISAPAQESGQGSNIPSTFHSYLQSTTMGMKRREAVPEDVEFKYDVIRQLEELFKSNPSALGLFIPFVSPKGFEQEELPSLVGGAEELKKAFSFLGHAVFQLQPNLESWQLKAALKGIAAMASKCPASFQQICVYFTGHGGENVVYTPDGKVPLTCFTDPLCTATAAQDDPLPKVFIFDTCNFGMKNILQDSISAVNAICVFASMPGNRAFAKTDGYGLLTYHLAKAIQAISKPFSVVVADAAEEVRKEINEHPEYGVVEPAECQPLVCQASRHSMDLLKERRKAMTPEIHIEPHPTAVSVKVSFPTSASHFNLTGCDVQCEGPSGFSQCEQLSLPGTNQVRIDGLCPGKQYKLKAVAKYVPTGFSEEEVSSEEQCVLIPAGVIPTVQLGPTGDTVTVTPPPLHEQYNMQSLSVKYWAEDEREEMARSVEVEAGQVQIHLPGKQRRKKYKAKAVAMYAISPESAVSSPPLTIPKEDTRIKLFWNHHKKTCKCFLVVLLLSLLVFPVVSVISAVVYNRLTGEAPVQELGYQGDMIFMGEIDSSRQKQVLVRECAKAHGDDPHYPSVYRVKAREDDLILHNSICNYDEAGYPVRDHECIVLPDYGEAPPPYLMRKSEISAHICLSSVNHSTESYPAYAYISKAIDVENLEDCSGSDFINQKPYKTLKIGSNNQSVCTWLNYTVKESDSPGYYKPYLVIPGQVYIRYNISFHRKYLNRTDFEEDLVCSEISKSDSCSVSTPGGLKREHYTVLVYIPDYESSFGNNTLSDVQPTTHACMHGEIFLEEAELIGGIIYSVLLLPILLILCLFFIRSLVRIIKDYYHRRNYDPV